MVAGVAGVVVVTKRKRTTVNGRKKNLFFIFHFTTQVGTLLSTFKRVSESTFLSK